MELLPSFESLGQGEEGGCGSCPETKLTTSKKVKRRRVSVGKGVIKDGMVL